MEMVESLGTGECPGAKVPGCEHILNLKAKLRLGPRVMSFEVLTQSK